MVSLTVVAYLPALRGGFIWDDDRYVTDNQTLRTAHGLREIWLDPAATVQYYPLTFSAFWCEYQLWGLHPFPFHLVNVLLQALNALLLWTLLRRLHVRGAWWAAAVFAVHPVHVMSVAWITELKNVWSGAFFLTALLAYLRYSGVEAAPPAAEPGRRWFLYGLALALFLCALLSKTSTSILPVAIVLILWWKRGHVARKDLVPLWPFFAVAILFGAFTLWLETHEKGAWGKEFTMPFLDRMLVAGRSFWFCLGKLLWPAQLTFIYPRWQINPTAVAPYLYVLAMVVLLLILWKARERIGRGPFAALVYFTLAFPALILVQVLFMMRYSFVSDHWQYLGSLSVFALVIGAIARGLARRNAEWQNAGRFVGGLMLITLGTLTWRQTQVYRDVETLWRDTLAKNPEAVMAHNNLGNLLLLQGKTAEAESHYEQALTLSPDFAEAHFNHGFILARSGKLDEAIREFQETVRLKPDHAKAQYNWGKTLAEQGKNDEAILHFQEALEIQPNYPEVHDDWGNILVRAGKLQEAIAHYEQAVRLKPEYADAHNNLGVALALTGATEQAISHFAEALRLRPNFADAARNLSAARDLQNNPDKASAVKLQQKN